MRWLVVAFLGICVTAAAAGPALADADLSVTVQVAPNPVQPTTPVLYTLTVVNAGPDAAANLTAQLTLPPAAPLVSADFVGWDSCQRSGDVITCRRATLAVGTAEPIRIAVRTPTTAGVIATAATVSSTTADPDTTNNDTVITTTVASPAAADLAISLAAAPMTVIPGAQLKYFIDVTNAGPDPSGPLTVTAALPQGATFVSTVGMDWSCSLTQQTVMCMHAAIAMGVAPEIAITVTAPGDRATISGSASVTSPVADPDASNNSATVTTRVSLPSTTDLALELTSDGPVTTRAPLTYFVAITDLGPGTPGALDVTIDTPVAATAVTASTAWSCTSRLTRVKCRAAEFTPDPIGVQIAAPDGATTVTATATLVATPVDLVESNNTASLTVDVVPSLTIRGGGCSTDGGASGLGVLGAVAGVLLASRRRRTVRAASASVVVLVVLVLAPRPAAAQAVADAKIPAERLQLSADRAGILGTAWATTIPQGSWTVGTWLGLADDLLVVDDAVSGERLSSIVHDRFGGSLYGAIGIARWLQLDIELPYVLAQEADRMPLTGDTRSTSLGDLRFAPKFVIRRGQPHHLGIGIIVHVTLPTSADHAFAGDRGATVAPELVLSRAFGAFRVALNGGYLARKASTLGDLVVDDEYRGRLGLAYRLPKQPLELALAAILATSTSRTFDHVNTDTAELDGGITYDARPDTALYALFGRGLGNGFGSPDWRIAVGVLYSSKPDRSQRDSDHDGIVDELDRCPDAPEDRDNFEDTDGCPDLDNDKDGILDADDQCRDAPEDRDGFQDADGCPDLDNDFDGIPDAKDKCPDAKEDRDGFEDDDGCPDLDNDGDGIPDAADRCRDEAGPLDNHGCPEADRDGDGVPDRRDNCPDEEGTKENHGCVTLQWVWIEKATLPISDPIDFKANTAILDKRSLPVLDEVAAIILSHPELYQVRVEGYSSAKRKHALELAEQRARAVVSYLSTQGVPRSRLSAKGVVVTHSPLPSMLELFIEEAPEIEMGP